MNLPFASMMPYWKTSRTTPDVWLEKAMNEIVRADGKVKTSGFGQDVTSRRAAYRIEFEVGGDQFSVTWPVLPTPEKAGVDEQRAARVQAVTLMYHDIKAKCVKARVFGMRTAFFEHLLLPDGREMRQAATPELVALLPACYQPARIGN